MARMGVDVGFRVRISGRITTLVHDVASGCLIREESGVVENIITDVGLDALAAALDSNAEDFEISVGTGTTAAASTDTALETEVYKADVTAKSASGAVFTAKLFIGSSSANGYTLSEAGLWLGGVLVDRALLSPTIVKNSNKTVTVQVDITLSR